MPTDSLYYWSETADDNGNTDATINWLENQNPDTVNNSARAMMSRHKKFMLDLAPTRASTGSANAYVVTSKAAGAALADGEIVAFRANHTNTGAATLNVNNRGAKPLRAVSGTALNANDILAGQSIVAYYNLANDEWLAHGTGYHVNALFASLYAAQPYRSILKAGSLGLWPTSSIPSGWLECNGAAVSRTTYAELYAVIGTTYGAGDGVTTFTLPDYRGEFLRGWDHGKGSDPDAASRTTRGDGTTGDNVGTKQASGTAIHTHAAGTLAADSNGAHTHIYSYANAVRGTGSSGGLVTSFLGADTISIPSSGAHTHTISGSTATSGGNETRPRNVTVVVCILANPSDAAAATLGVVGLQYTWDTGTTDADPGNGKLRVNHATPASATQLYISETDGHGATAAPTLATWDDSSSTVKGILRVFKVGAPAVYLEYSISGSIVDAGTYDKFALTYIGGAGALANGDLVSVVFSRTGDAGATGAAGGGITWTWDTGTTDADPGNGKVRGNNGTLASITELYVSTTDANSASVTTWLDALDDSTSTSMRGYLQLAKSSAPSDYRLYQITSVTSASGYRKIAVSHVGGAGLFSAADAISITTMRTGDKGDTGAPGANGTDSGIRWHFASSTSMENPGPGAMRLNHATLASVTAMAVSDNCAESGNPDVSTFVLAWDDSTTTGLRGTLILKKVSAPQTFGVYSITGASTDNSGWTELAVTHVVSSGSLSDGDTLAVQFTRTGDKGADGAGAGDVVGPASATDNAIVRFDGTTGKLVQNSAVTIDDTTGRIGGARFANAGLKLEDTNASHLLTIAAGSDLTADRTLTVTTGDANRTVTISGNPTLGDWFDQSVKSSAAPSFTLVTATNGLFRAVSGNYGTMLHNVGDYTYFFNTNFGDPYGGASTGRPLWWDNATGDISLGGSYLFVRHGSGVEIGHFHDTTLTRAAAGILAVEGVPLKLAGKETIWIPAAAMTARTTNGAASGTTELPTNKVMLSSFDFDTTTREVVGFMIAMPKSWNESTVTFKPMWTAASGSGGVVWGLAARAFSDADAMDAAVSGQQTSTDTLITANAMHIGPESGAITIGGSPAEGDVVYFELTREVANASDTLGVDAKLLGIHLYITTNAATDA